MCRDNIDARDINEANRWMCEIEILSTGLKEKRVCTNLFKFRSHNAMVRVSRKILNIVQTVTWLQQWIHFPTTVDREYRL